MEYKFPMYDPHAIVLTGDRLYIGSSQKPKVGDYIYDQGNGSVNIIQDIHKGMATMKEKFVLNGTLEVEVSMDRLVKILPLADAYYPISDVYLMPSLN